MSAPRDATRVLADCPCSGCTATRVLADVLAALEEAIVTEQRSEALYQSVAPRAFSPRERRTFLNFADRAGHAAYVLRRVRRAARGGRDGGGAT